MSRKRQTVTSMPTPSLQQQARAWQPIETAPKDSSWLLALMRTGRQAVVRWGGGTWEDDNRLCRDPTHWMPLPDPPTATDVEQEDQP